MQHQPDRIVDEQLANFILTLDVIGEGCDGMGDCSNPNMQGGEFTFSGGIAGDAPFATMILNYEPPSATEEAVLWMYGVMYKSPLLIAPTKVESRSANSSV